MEPAAYDFFKQLLNAPSPSGYEEPAQEIVRQYVKGFAEEVTTDLHGNVIAAINVKSPLRVMLAGHADQIGLMVQHIDSDGFIWVQPIGGWDPQQLIGQRVVIWAKDGPVTGIISRKAIHLLTDEERKQVPKMKDLWVDIGCKDREEVQSLICIGDPITLELGLTELRNGYVCGPQMDDKTGLWIAVEALRRAAQQGVKCALYAVSTVQEEIGLRGAKTSAYGIDPQVGIAIDVTHATDCPTIDKKQEGDIGLGRGPVVYRGPNMNRKLVEKLGRTATAHDIPFQWGAISRATPTDANVMQLNRAGMATGLLSVPNRYMHSGVEMISLRDIDHAADLLAKFACSLAADEDFTP